MKNSTLTTLAIFFLSVVSKSALANCTYNKGQGPQILNFTLPSTLSIPADAPNGTVLYTSEQTIAANSGNDMTCTADFYYGAVDARGQNVASGTFPIGDTGLAWEWHYQGTRLRQYPAGRLSATPNGTLYSFGATTHGLKIVKIGAIKSDAKVPAGILGRYKDYPLFPFTMVVNESIVVLPSCKTPDITVRMGSYTLSAIGMTPGSTSDPVTFGIKLTDCPAGFKKISYRFLRVGETYDYRNGVIRLNASSSAKGFGIQIKHSNGRPAVVDGTTLEGYEGYDSRGGNFEIPMTAAYYRIQNEELKPGTANSELSFEIEYL
ncbi:fimbrial protein [Pseudomonas sp. G3-19]